MDYDKIQFDGQTRESGIECIKIFAMILMITGHVIQTLALENTFISYLFILAFLLQSGLWGNMIFFGCSAWFLIESTKVNKRKWLFLLFEVWSVSVIILVVTYVLRDGDISLKMIIQCLMPNTFF